MVPLCGWTLVGGVVAIIYHFLFSFASNRNDVHNFRKLRIYEASMSLCREVYSLTSGFPKYERYGLSDQLRRCSVSVPSNIAEGCSRTSRKDVARFVTIALGSAYEVETQLVLANDFGYANTDMYTVRVRELQSQLLAFRNSLLGRA